MKHRGRAFTAARRACAAAGLLLAAGCQSGAEVTITVRSPADIDFTIEKAGRFCLNSMMLWRGAGRDGPPIWEIRLRQPPREGPCTSAIRFPVVPADFEVVRPIAALPPGNYVVEMYGGAQTALAAFEVPQRAR